ncbi:MAG: carboxypeptidase family protein [Kordiimonadaceae bacterium]|nr:carboxypeptidase family protein [Kordiimonadaceae bacterium]
MKISSNFDSGNINVIDASSPGNIRLSINKDNNSHFYQWFHFRLTGAKGQLCALHIENAADAAYPLGWENYQAVASYDHETWFRVSTVYKNGVLTIQHVPETDSVYYAYFAPYSYDRHQALVSSAASHERVRLDVIGESCDGRDLDLLTIGEEDEDKKKIWIFARQHPGESMAEWLVEGVLERLLDDDDALSRGLLEKCVFYVMPNVNPDGSIRGHLRCNAKGQNLNRDWADPDPELSPEIYYLRAKMDEKGLDFSLDCHGDEALPYNFIACFEGVPELNQFNLDTAYLFGRELEKVNPDFQNEKGYEKNEPGKGNLGMSTNQIAHRFDAVAMTLEMPFKDTIDSPNPETGWSPERSRKLGYSTLDALSAVLERL